MTFLRQVELHLDGSYSNEQAKAFLQASRCCCNYLERALRGVRFKSPYSRLIILCTKDRREVLVRPLEHEPYLEAIIFFRVTLPSALTHDAAQKQFMNAILAGINAASRFTPMPIEDAERILCEFEAGGFVNQWVAREKNWARLKCRCVIRAEMTMESLTLDQVVYLDGESVAERRIAQTMPREGLYERYLGEFSSDTKGRVVYKAQDRVLTAFDVTRRVFLDVPGQKNMIGAQPLSKS